MLILIRFQKSHRMDSRHFQLAANISDYHVPNRIHSLYTSFRTYASLNVCLLPSGSIHGIVQHHAEHGIARTEQ